MPRRNFHFAGAVLRVETAEAPLAWLHEFVAPYFPARDCGAHDRTIVLTIDALEHARLARCGPHPRRLAKACFTLDSGIANGRVWNAPGAAEVVFDEELGAFYRRSPGDLAVVEIVAARDRAETRLALLRVVREYAMLYATRAGWLILHAAAVDFGDYGLVIAGPKRAGKTTLLLHALRNERGRYVSNDRVALSGEPSGVTAHGLPTIVSIRKESARWFAGLDARFDRARYHYSRRATERNGDVEARSPTPAPTWGLSPGQLCELLGVSPRASTPVAAVLFPRVGASTGSVTFEPLTADHAVAAWQRTLFRSCPPDGVFAIGTEAATSAEAARLAARVPSYACSLGPDAYAAGVRWLSASPRSLASRPALVPLKDALP
jgi:hypothetical protein